MQILIRDDLILGIEQETHTNPWTRQVPPACSAFGVITYTVPFNKGFTEIIRQPQSWGHSDAWDILSGYRGHLLIIAAENDQVIPQGVINKIYDSAVNAKECKLFVAPQASHSVFTDLRSNNPESFCSVLRQIVEILK